MIFLLMSDIHNRYDRMVRIVRKEVFDAVIIAGDFTYGGSLDDVSRALRMIREHTDKPIYFVPGNCDPAELLEFGLDDDGIYNLHGRVIRIGHLYLLGIGGSNITPFNTPIEFTEDEIRSILNSIGGEYRPEKTILVSHVPPYNTVDILHSGVPVGSIALREYIDRVKPLAVLCGHVHESSGYTQRGGTLIVNPGPVMYSRYAIINIDDTIIPELRLEY